MGQLNSVLNAVEKGKISGVGVWPFAVSIILFSLFIDKIGYGRAMVFAFVAHITYAIVVICAPLLLAAPGQVRKQCLPGKQAGYWMLYFGNFIFALGNGTVEAVINPVVATMFSRDKTKWLNILHAGWPGGLVLGGLIDNRNGYHRLAMENRVDLFAGGGVWRADADVQIPCK